MRFHVVTLFPDIVLEYCKTSILGRAQEAKAISVRALNPRDFTADRHRKVDDKPYGGGPGMVMYAEPIVRAVESVTKKKTKTAKKMKVIVFAPGGKAFTNAYAKRLAKQYTDIVLVSGRYEGIDARAKKILKAEEVSIGDYVLTGGEVPAMAVIDAVSRQIPGVLGKFESVEEGRAASSELYTRPETLEWAGKRYRVPAVLRSGDHKKIDAWREKKDKKGK